jgi:Ubinuclein conserved middle domain
MKGFLKRKKSGRRICCYGVRIFLVLHPLSSFFLLLLLIPLLFSYLDKRQEKLRTEAAEASTGTGSAGPTRHPTEEMDVDSNSNQPLGVGGAGGDVEGGKDGKDGKDHGQHPPAKRYRLTDTMKSMVWELVLLSNECCRLENEKKSVFNDYIQLF